MGELVSLIFTDDVDQAVDKFFMDAEFIKRRGDKNHLICFNGGQHEIRIRGKNVRHMAYVLVILRNGGKGDFGIMCDVGEGVFVDVVPVFDQAQNKICVRA